VRVEAPRRAVTLDDVRAHQDAITRLGERFGVRNIRVFGSVARSEATPTATWTCWSTSTAVMATSTWPCSPWGPRDARRSAWPHPDTVPHSFRATSGPVIRLRSGNVEAMIASEATSPPATVAQYVIPGMLNAMPTWEWR
jgi:hypothetical protein